MILSNHVNEIYPGRWGASGLPRAGESMPIFNILRENGLRSSIKPENLPPSYQMSNKLREISSIVTSIN